MSLTRTMTAPKPSRGDQQFEGFWPRLLVLIAVVAALLLAIKARGQVSPAGNEHPQTRILAQEGTVNPFGPPERRAVETDAKAEFAARVDLNPLRDLAIGQGNRVKILDTVARETVGAITGRKDYFDVQTTPAGGEVRRRFDPLFTYLDLIIDPSYYEQRPLIHVNYLPLREQILEGGVPDAKERERLKRLGRLSPVLIASQFDAVTASPASTEAMQKALNQLHDGLQRYSMAAQDLNLIAPADAASPWTHLSAADPASPVHRAALDLGRAWRAGDAAGVNAAVAVLAAELPKIHPEVYPGARRGLERVYNRANFFEWGFWLYALALLSFLLSFGTARRWLFWLGVGALSGAVAMHALGFTARCLIAERFAIQNQFESMTGVSLFAAIIGVALALTKRQAIFAAATAAVGFIILITATQTGIPGYSIDREAAILNTSVLLKYHVTTVLFSYGLIALGFFVSLFYLATHYLSARTVSAGSPALAGAGGGDGVAPPAQISAAALGIDQSRPVGPARVLADLDAAQMTILQLAFWTLGVGILLGAWWADHSWGRWWAFDPKELWALLTWIVYLVVVHLRFAQVGNKPLLTAWLSVLGFFVMLWCYFGVNLLLPGLHAYA
jgi:cytochrome c-type biogenesis protein CcsB